MDELRIAWRGSSLYNSSHVSLATAVLDAHDRPLSPQEIARFLDDCGANHGFTANKSYVKSKSFKLAVDSRERWSIPAGYPRLASVRAAIRKRVAIRVESDVQFPSEAELEVREAARRRQKERRREEIRGLRRAIVHAWPVATPKVLVLVDVATRAIQCFRAGDLEVARQCLLQYDVLAGLDVHAIVLGLGVDPGVRRLSDLALSQKSARFSPQGRVQTVTLESVLRGSCRIRTPVGRASKLEGLTRRNKLNELERALVSDAKSLHAMYQYGRLHGRLWAAHDRQAVSITANWADWEDERITDILMKSLELHAELEAVIGVEVDWEDPWSSAVLRIPIVDGHDWFLVTQFDETWPAHDVQCVRLLGDEA